MVQWELENNLLLSIFKPLTEPKRLSSELFRAQTITLIYVGQLASQSFIAVLFVKYQINVHSKLFQTNCNQVWYDGTPRKYQIFYTYEGVSLNAEVSSANWKWVSNNTEWTVYYKEWPQKGKVMGKF